MENAVNNQIHVSQSGKVSNKKYSFYDKIIQKSTAEVVFFILTPSYSAHVKSSHVETNWRYWWVCCRVMQWKYLTTLCKLFDGKYFQNLTSLRWDRMLRTATLHLTADQSVHRRSTSMTISMQALIQVMNFTWISSLQRLYTV